MSINWQVRAKGSNADSASDFVNAVHNLPAGQDVLLLVWSKGNASYRTVHPETSEQNG